MRWLWVAAVASVAGCDPPPAPSDASADIAACGATADAGAARDGDPAWPPDEPLPAAFDFPPWLTMPAPGRIVVSWRTVAPSTGLVSFGPVDGWRRGLATVGPAAYLHHVDLGVLRGGTTYAYEVSVDGARAARRRGVFVTPGGEAVRVVHLGEFHAPSEADGVALFGDEIRAFRPHVVVESGDMVDDGDRLADWRSYLRTSAPWISNVILLPCGSNHVDGPGGNALLQELFVLPGNERWYETRFGPVLFLTLDSTYSSLNPDIAAAEPGWLAGAVTAAHDGADDPAFVVAAWHYPACSSSYAPRAASRAWVMEHLVVPMQAAGGADLVLVGHDTYYERSRIDLGAGARPLLHVMSNVGRLAPSLPGDNRPECTPLGTHLEFRSITEVTVTPVTLTARVVEEYGAEIDSFCVARHAPP
ncbi:MAG TPA: metallophosphoesterase [Myxococcota bacterium]|nr:metallophosphoesterase [Myxococcota bacterium]